MAKFKVGDKVKFVIPHDMDFLPAWVQESANKKILTIAKIVINRNDVTYFMEELPYAYSERWIEFIEKPVQKPKFKIGDIVVKDNVTTRFLGTNTIPAKITDILEIHSHGTEEVRYRYLLENHIAEYDEGELKLADKDDILVQSLKICSKDNGSCEGCHYQDISDGCNKLEKDAADCIERLKAKIKELEKND
jgi:hypothetical protein